MHEMPRRRGHHRAVIAATLSLLAACGAPGTHDCAVPQDARQRFVRAGEPCSPDGELRRLGFAWNGYECQPILTGDCRHAGCDGDDCGALFGSLGGCRSAYAGCEGTCGARTAGIRDEVPTHPVCRATPNPPTDFPRATFESCRRDSDCLDGVNGRCVYSAWDLVYELSCRYDECLVDADCSEGRVCSPLYEGDPAVTDQGNLFCVRATCTESADCSEGGACVLEQAPSYGIFSPTPNDYHYECDSDICGADAPTTVHRVTTLEIPTMADVTAGLALGQNVDAAGDTCEVEDFPGGIDNALLTLNAGLLELGSATPLDLQAELDAALACEAPSAACEPLTLTLVAQQCNGMTVVSLRDAEGQTLAAPVSVILYGGTDLRVQFPALLLPIPVRTPSGVTFLALELEGVILHGTLTPTGFHDLVLGGAVRAEAMLEAFTAVLGELTGGPTVEEVTTLLAGLSDVQLNGVCGAVSVGLRATAEPAEELP